MIFENYTIEEIVSLRSTARTEKNWALSDKSRDYLDSKHVFIFDSKEGQIVYYETATKRVVKWFKDEKGEYLKDENGQFIKDVTIRETTRQDVVDKINADNKADALFDAWLYTMSRKRN